MTGRLTILRLIFLGAVAIAIWLDIREPRPTRERSRALVGAWSVLMIAFVGFLWVNHVNFAGHLDLMEGAILQHVAQAAHGLPVYPVPTPAYVPLAYNPLYYYLCVPFTWVMGLDLPALRVVAIIGMALAGYIIYAAVRDRTQSAWWGLIALAFYATAYRVMDAYLDTAHSDSWLLASALAGTYVIGRSETRLGRLGGVVLLTLAFWFKQHGALFAIGGVLYLTWREGLVKSWPYWVVAIVLGPVLYAIAPLGVDFHYFTLDVPRGWSKVNVETFARLMRFVAGNYLPLFIAAAVEVTRAVREERGAAERHLNRPVEQRDSAASTRRGAATVWHVQFIIAFATACMGSLDWGSSDNVFIPFGAFTIVLGTFGLAEIKSVVVQVAAVAIAFTPLMYAPQTVVVSWHSHAALADLEGVVKALPGSVYAPGIGQFAGPPIFSPGAHWLAIEDMERGPGHNAADEARAFALLDPVVHPAGHQFVLTARPLVGMTAPLSLLEPHYTLAQDYGDRFIALTGTPKRYSHGFPRYLYEFRQ
jgi:hypothetical protein